MKGEGCDNDRGAFYSLQSAITPHILQFRFEVGVCVCVRACDLCRNLRTEAIKLCHDDMRPFYYLFHVPKKTDGVGRFIFVRPEASNDSKYFTIFTFCYYLM
jgi:hypothetical protein